MSIKDLVPKFGKRSEQAPVRRKREDSLLSFQREMNRLFDDFFSGFDLGPALDAGEESVAKACFSPKVDVLENDREVKVTAELPGMDEKDIAVELGEDVITIRGEKKEEQEEKGKNWCRREQSYGSFHRAIPLPAGTEGEKAKARFKRGKLTVTVPKSEQARSNRRSIRIDSD